MKLVDPSHPFFRPLWARVAVTLAALGWGAFEFATGSPFWAVLFLAAGGWCVWALFLAPRGEDEGSDDG